MQMDGRRRSNRIKKKNEVRSNKEKPKAEGKRKEKRNRKVRGQMRSEEDANMAARRSPFLVYDECKLANFESKEMEPLEDKKEEMEDIPVDDIKANNMDGAKKVYRRVDIKKKVELAKFCRDFELRHDRAPKCKELRGVFP